MIIDTFTSVSRKVNQKRKQNRFCVCNYFKYYKNCVPFNIFLTKNKQMLRRESDLILKKSRTKLSSILENRIFQFSAKTFNFS